MKESNLKILYFISGALFIGAFFYFAVNSKKIADKETDVSLLPLAVETENVYLKNGDSYVVEAKQVKKVLRGTEVAAYAYNGSIPGPIIHLTQGDSIDLVLKNNLHEPTLLHSHGVRMDYKYDGTHLTQHDIEPGESFEYKLSFPDAGVYWYHPHLREDRQQEKGLYGMFIVTPNEVTLPQAEEVPLVLDDVLMSQFGLAPFYDSASHVMMGRFGNLMLINGDDNYQRVFEAGRVYRLLILNAANVRPFNFTIPGVKLLHRASDGGLLEKSKIVDSVTISPSERAVVDVIFTKAGEYEIKNTNPVSNYTLGKLIVKESKNSEVIFNESLQSAGIDRELINGYLQTQPDKTLRLSVDMGSFMNSHGSAMNNMPCHRMPNGQLMGDCGPDAAEGGHVGGIEWEDTMSMMNQFSSPENVTWQLIDDEARKINDEIEWTFKKGDLVKIRIVNDNNSDHPMQHPIHLHGQRFLVINQDGVINDNLAWKDTVLVPTGQTYDILVEMSNPGDWMIHCHIAEHLEAGMALSFSVR